MENNHGHVAVEDSELTIAHQPGGWTFSGKGTLIIFLLFTLLSSGAQLYSIYRFETHLDKQDTHAEGTDIRIESNRNNMVAINAKLDTHQAQSNARIVGLEELLREIERTCLMTPEQRLKVQQKLSPRMKELLLKELKEE